MNADAKTRCACGCGASVRAGRRYLHGHNRASGAGHRRRSGESNPTITCACGCGASLTQFSPHGERRAFVRGHNQRGRARDPEAQARSAASYIGVPLAEYVAHKFIGDAWCSFHRAWHPRSAFYASASRASGVQSRCRNAIRMMRGLPEIPTEAAT